MKTIVIIGPAYPLRGGGMATFNERMAREFMKEGHRVIIYTFSLQYPGFLFPGKSQYSTEAPPADLDIRVKINSVSPLNWLQTGRELRALRPDLIVVRYWLPFMGPCLGTILRIAKKNRHSEVVCIADNIRPHEARPGDRAFTKYFIKPIDRFIVMSRNVLSDLRSFTASTPALLVRHPLYDNFGPAVPKTHARAALGVSDDEQVLLFFGFIRKYKGLDLLLEAITLLKQRDALPGLRLIIAGEFYEDEAPYRKKIADAGLQAMVVLHAKFIGDAEVANYFCAADAVVQPYRNATQSGVTPLAYHYEVPMIVTNVGGLPDMVPHEKAGLVTAPDAEAIARSIEAFFNSSPQRFSAGLREEKASMSWKHFAESVISFR